MTQIQPKRLALIAVVIIIAGVVVWQLFTNLTAAELLTEKQARSKVESLYNGKIVKVREQNQLFVFELELDAGSFEVEINRETGEIGSLTKLNNQISKQPENKGNKEGPTEQQTDTNSPPTDHQAQLISEEEAKEIALQQINGTIDEFETKDIDGVIYYFVEVERDDGEEGTVQIHGLTGEVVSISWDD
ncbi:PepSY domain-containing protein [Bacillus marasmi]|uniref:PepSY domain-containing protein n=1 Tax=Bacillus marasmi TaxID=1926279 RepID=UPI0011C81CCB|nr:PepSY domain-containing protein [Bacillus marasmi]